MEPISRNNPARSVLSYACAHAGGLTERETRARRDSARLRARHAPTPPVDPLASLPSPRSASHQQSAPLQRYQSGKPSVAVASGPDTPDRRAAKPIFSSGRPLDSRLPEPPPHVPSPPQKLALLRPRPDLTSPRTPDPALRVHQPDCASFAPICATHSPLNAPPPPALPPRPQLRWHDQSRPLSDRKLAGDARIWTRTKHASGFVVAAPGRARNLRPRANTSARSYRPWPRPPLSTPFAARC